MAKSDRKGKKSLLKRLKEIFSGVPKSEKVDLKKAYRLPNKKVRLPHQGHPFRIYLQPAGKPLHLYPERPLGGSSEKEDSNYILFNPKKYFSQISGFLRIHEGEWVYLGSQDPNQQTLLNLPPELPEKKLSIFKDQEGLVFKNNASPSSCISPLLKGKKVNRIVRWRRKKLQRLRKIYGGPIRQKEKTEAIALISAVNKIMEEEAYRPKDQAGRPGGLLAIPKEMQTFIIGDLHAKPDNLLSLLSQNGFLEAMEKAKACLVILGDAVHNEEEGQYEEMKNSLVIMDLIFRLKQHFPRQLFYLRGNHDSFSGEIAKGGVLQGVLWEETLKKVRGKVYCEEMARLYAQLPYVAYSHCFIACHAAPPVSTVTRRQIVNIKDNPKLIKELINNRMRRSGSPSGYGKGDIHRFRKCLGVSQNTPLIVGHTPMSTNETLWERVGDIDGHHIVYASDRHWVGVMAQIGEKMYPFRYPVEPIISLMDDLSD